MSILLPETQAKVEETLISNGLLSQAELAQLKTKAAAAKLPILAYLINNKRITDEQLTKALAEVNGLPNVNFSNIRGSEKTLSPLPKDIAQQQMAVPIGEMQNYLVVSMLDADNIQAVDFLSSKIG